MRVPWFQVFLVWTNIFVAYSTVEITHEKLNALETDTSLSDAGLLDEIKNIGKKADNKDFPKNDEDDSDYPYDETDSDSDKNQETTVSNVAITVTKKSDESNQNVTTTEAITKANNEKAGPYEKSIPMMNIADEENKDPTESNLPITEAVTKKPSEENHQNESSNCKCEVDEQDDKLKKWCPNGSVCEIFSEYSDIILCKCINNENSVITTNHNENKPGEFINIISDSQSTTTVPTQEMTNDTDNTETTKPKRNFFYNLMTENIGNAFLWLFIAIILSIIIWKCCAFRNRRVRYRMERDQRNALAARFFQNEERELMYRETEN